MTTIPADWLTLLRLLPGYDPLATAGDSWFDPEAAQHAIGFIEECIVHIEGQLKGKPFLLQPWQKAFVANLFGWKCKDELGRTVRRYREALLYVPRKNGKTPLAAAIALYVFFCDGEPGAQCYVAAKNREEAGKLFRHMKGMVQAEPELNSRCRVYGGTAQAGQAKSIVLRDDETAFVQVVAGDADTQHGGTTHLAIVDELHAQPDGELVGVFKSSLSSLNRKQPLLIYLTTADSSGPSICNQTHARACQVRDNPGDPAKPGYNPRFLPAIWEAGPKDDWTDPAVWRRVNPNLGVSKSMEYMAAEVKGAQENPAEENRVKRLDLNIITSTTTKAIPMEHWRAIDAGVNPVKWRQDMLAKLRGRECWGSLDLGSTSDLTATGLLFREPVGYIVLPFFWCCRAQAKARQAARIPYLTWEQQGFVRITEGNVTDYRVVRHDINQLAREYIIKDIAADRWNASQIITELMEDGAQVVGFGQGFKDMAAPTKELIEMVIAERLYHGQNPVLEWQAGNAAVESDAAGNQKFTKKGSADKIDGIIALTMCLGRALLCPDTTPTLMWI